MHANTSNHMQLTTKEVLEIFYDSNVQIYQCINFKTSTVHMVKIPIIDESPKELRCTTCLLPMQYQTKKNGKFLWQCFKCGKQFLVSSNSDSIIEESQSPPR